MAKEYLTLEQALEMIFDKDSDDDGDEENEIDIVIPPETAEASDEEEGNDNILNNDNDVLPGDTAGEIEVHVKKKLDQWSSASLPKRIKKRKLKPMKWTKNRTFF